MRLIGRFKKDFKQYKSKVDSDDKLLYWIKENATAAIRKYNSKKYKVTPSSWHYIWRDAASIYMTNEEVEEYIEITQEE